MGKRILPHILFKGKFINTWFVKDGALLNKDTVFINIIQAGTGPLAGNICQRQLYPLPVNEIRAALAKYPEATDFAWVQEEPANQGAWSYIALNLLEHLNGVALRRISRPAAAAPAGGSAKMHEVELQALLEASLPRVEHSAGQPASVLGALARDAAEQEPPKGS